MYKKYIDSLPEKSTEITELRKRCNFLVEKELCDIHISILEKTNPNSPCDTCLNCAKSFSCLRSLKSYLRNSMCQERLSALAVLKIENTVDIDITKEPCCPRILETRNVSSLTPARAWVSQKVCVTRKELLTIVKFVEHFHHYLYGQKFLLRTDHASLRWLLNFKEPEGQIARWIRRLQEYDFEIQHRKGTSHGNADALSRRPCKESCKHCANAEKKFGIETDTSVKVLTTTSVDPWSSCEIQKAQLEDPAIKPILEKKLNSADRPSWQEIAPESPATKRYWVLSDSLHLKDGALYHRWESDDGSSCRWQLFLAKSRIPEVFCYVYDC
ncbi:hypothetical protein AVEN_256908-1 [Araneus ventricosus]|uniref:Reverse transcriptase RNase H-like domain-containing protein n=1 Tax=Araneus ventricosus TaxID=182803 RepID=A0A4Y2CHD7_ARAVE|nr:hypothetical protein AVEN_256908-1 [Araneus ventricosus]